VLTMPSTDETFGLGGWATCALVGVLLGSL
jgi:hypothetical protein